MKEFSSFPFFFNSKNKRKDLLGHGNGKERELGFVLQIQ